MARVVEAAGIPTVALSVNRAYSEKVRAPRTVFLPFPYGSVFGEPGDAKRQREVLLAMLGMLETADDPGSIVDLPMRWRR
ncbi:MAG: hypothetical protein ACYC33_11775 [Thermoleophilia bacterium]